MSTAELPKVPKSIITDKDKGLLKTFMETHYPTAVLDMRKNFDNLFDDAKETIKRTKAQHKRVLDVKVNTAALYEERKEALAPLAPAHTRFLLENDTTKWPWDYDQIKFDSAGIGLGTCFILLKKFGDRRIAVDRESASLYFVR